MMILIKHVSFDKGGKVFWFRENLKEIFGHFALNCSVSENSIYKICAGTECQKTQCQRDWVLKRTSAKETECQLVQSVNWYRVSIGTECQLVQSANGDTLTMWVQPICQSHFFLNIFIILEYTKVPEAWVAYWVQRGPSRTFLELLGPSWTFLKLIEASGTFFNLLERS